MEGDDNLRLHPKMTSTWHSTQEMCELLDVTRRTLRRRAEAGDLETKTEGRHKLWRLCDTFWVRERLEMTPDTTPDMSGVVSGLSGIMSDVSGIDTGHPLDAHHVRNDVRNRLGSEERPDREVEDVRSRCPVSTPDTVKTPDTTPDIDTGHDLELEELREQLVELEHENEKQRTELEAYRRREQLSLWRHLLLIVFLRAKLTAERFAACLGG